MVLKNAWKKNLQQNARKEKKVKKVIMNTAAMFIILTLIGMLMDLVIIFFLHHRIEGFFRGYEIGAGIYSVIYGLYRK